MAAKPKGYEEPAGKLKLDLYEVPLSRKEMLRGADLACAHIPMSGPPRVSDYHRLSENDGTCLALCLDCRRTLDPYIKAGELTEAT